MEATSNIDLLLIQRLATELQIRIGLLPKIDVYAFHLEAKSGEILQIMRAQPRSLSEIVRVIRSARTMKLTVRGMGHATGSEKAIYADKNTVLVDCCQLNDKPRMQLTEIQREGEGKITPALRVLAGVSIDEFTDFLVENNVETYQWADINSGLGTIVGSVVSGGTGLVSPAGGAQGGSIADEVVAVRILDSRGELIEYSAPEALREMTTNLGLLGIVYDVFLRYRTLSVSTVRYDFFDWCHLTSSVIVRNSIYENDVTELIYMPFNGINPEIILGNFVRQWCALSDSVIMRTCKRLPTFNDEPLYSHPRQHFHLIDPIMGPDIHEIISEPSQTPLLLSQAFRALKRKLIEKRIQTQYTPWAMNTFAPLPSPSRMLRFSIETGPTLDNFSQTMRSLLDILMQLLKNEGGEEYNFGLNLCMRIQFTGGTHCNKLSKVGCLKSCDELTNRLLAHITIASLLRPGPNTDWVNIASEVTKHSLNNIPKCVFHWTTEWHDLTKILHHIKKNVPKRWGPFRYQMLKRDRDGVFMNEILQSIFFTRLEDYQREYREQREVQINHI